jgi:exportin-5
MNGASFRMSAPEDGDGRYSSVTSNITYALQVIHNSRSDNETRQKASEFLESQKTSPYAAQNGYSLAGDEKQPAVVRHFGLSLLEHTVCNSWHSFNDAQVLNIRNWTITLAQGISDDDPVYLRNKIAHLLVEVAKKDWAVTWFDLDSSLLTLWEKGIMYKELVLTVLENLSEDVFVREDPAAGIRGQDLHNAVVEIFTPASAFSGGQNKARSFLRADDDGWLARISRFLESACQIGSNQRDGKTCICKALATLRSAFTWTMGSAIITTRCLESIFACLVSSDTEVLLVGNIHSLGNQSTYQTNVPHRQLWRPCTHCTVERIWTSQSSQLLWAQCTYPVMSLCCATFTHGRWSIAMISSLPSTPFPRSFQR